MKIALIYNDPREEGHTTGAYCLRALKDLGHTVRHFNPTDIPQIEKDAYDLYLNIDDGGQYALPRILHPSALWAIDTHILFERTLKRAPHYDHLFAAQKDGAAKLKKCEWLPLGADPTVHRPLNLPKIYEVVFVGALNTDDMRKIYLWLMKKFGINVKYDKVYLEGMVRLYNQGKIGFNKSVRNDVNMRVFEVMSMGTFLLTNRICCNGLFELFKEGQHLVSYGPFSLIPKIKYYLKHEKEREEIAKAGQTEVHKKHTYRHRMEALLKSI